MVKDFRREALTDGSITAFRAAAQLIRFRAAEPTICHMSKWTNRKNKVFVLRKKL
jgi:hypothetical protein